MVARIEFACPRIGIDGIRDLVVAALVETAQVEPDLGDIRVDSDGAGISVKRVAELVDLEVQDANGTPECRVASVAVDSLLVCFVCLVVLLPCHVSTPEEIPALGIRRVYGEQ